MPDAKAQSIDLPGGITLTPSMGVNLRYDDNIDNTVENEEESWLTVTTPNLLLEADSGVSAYSLSYSLSRADYLNADRDSYTDQELLVDATWNFHSRHRVEMNVEMLDIQQQPNNRAAVDLASLILERERYIEKEYSTTYTFGAEGARGRVEVTVGHNERDFVEEDGGRDLKVAYASGLFSFNIAGETDLLVRIEAAELDYEQQPDESDFDSREVNYMVGAEREGEVLSVGVMAGVGARTFEDPQVEDFKRPRWEAVAAWRPLENTELIFTAERATEETRGFANVIDAKSASVAWNHEWTGRISTEMSFRYTNADFEDSNVVENIRSGFASVEYEFLDGVTLLAGVTVLNQSATEPIFAEDRTRVFFGFEAALS
ncbi:outer membrane beta-barrel protein [Microbulbifer aestuariivivens]